ncbi:MAG: hypothetical protein ACKVOR_02880 [Flavobacteriales bacterium]
MNHIKEPTGINFLVDPTPLTIEYRKRISEIIADYKRTGRKPLADKTMQRQDKRLRNSNNRLTSKKTLKKLTAKS